MWLHYGERSYRSADGGTNWVQATGAPSDGSAADLSAAWFFDDKNGLALVGDGALLGTSDSGLTWSVKVQGQAYSYAGSRLQFHSPSTGWAQGLGSTRSKTTDGGTSWWSPQGIPGNLY